MKLCIATNNSGKLLEIKSILSNQFEILSLKDIGCNTELPENGETLQDNSLEKALFVFQNYHINCFADDSGLEVEALGGAPGVYSARYAGNDNNPENNILKLLKGLQGIENRNAQFRTIITLILNGEIKTFEGIVKGHIISELKGNQGFGYDPVFVPEGFSKTFAEMDFNEKNLISHRGKAMKLLISYLNSIS